MAVTPGGPFLDLTLEPSLWLIGPTPDRPCRRLAPGCGRRPVRDLRDSPEQEHERGVVEAVLGSTARQHPSPLPLFVLRWPAVTETPLAVFLGLMERDPADLAARWLSQEDLDPVEAPVVESLDAGAGTSLHRSLGYGVDANNGVVVSVRYAVDAGRPDALVLAHAVSDVPRDILAATDDIEAMLRTVTVTDSPVDA